MKALHHSLLGILACCSLLAGSGSHIATAAELKFNVVPDFFEKNPGGKQLGPCHGGVVIDKAGNFYVTTDTDRGIVVFSPEGKYVRSFGPTKIHALEMRDEGGSEVIYAARPSAHEVIKLKLDGTQEWSIKYPEESKVLEKADGFNPCALTVGPDGSIFVADGYGSNRIYKFDKDRKFVKAFGEGGKSPGFFNTCHGIALDRRGEKPLLFVCNRNNNRVEHWDLEGNFVKVLQADLRMPAAVHIRGDYAVIPELQGRVTVMDKTGAIVAQIGDNPNGKQRGNFGLKPEEWTEGITNSPHGASIDKDGNLIVAEWTAFGRVHKFALSK
jgi:hypothetical protein